MNKQAKQLNLNSDSVRHSVINSVYSVSDSVFNSIALSSGRSRVASQILSTSAAWDLQHKKQHEQHEQHES